MRLRDSYSEAPRVRSRTAARAKDSPAGHDITAAQLRAARAVLEWSREELGKAAGVSASTVKNYESGKTTIPLVATAIERTLVEAGIRFLTEDEGGPGVSWRRLRKPSPPLAPETPQQDKP